MRVLWFTNTPAAGDEFISSNGTGGWLKSLDKAIQDKVELHVVFDNHRYPDEFVVGKTTYHQIAPHDKMSLVIRLLKQKHGKNPDLPHYLDLINKIKPDIIHIHGTEMAWIELAKYTDVPVVLSVQAILTVMNFKYFSGITRKDLSFNSKYLSNYKIYQKSGVRERENLQYVKYVLGRTDWDRRCYSILAPHARYYICNEILREGFYNNQWKEPNYTDNKIIVHTTTGRLLFKGLETICKAVSELERIGVDIEWRVAGIAENDEIVTAVRHRMGARFPQKGLALLGPLDEKVLIEKMLEAHIYVNASHQDNSPNSLCEATLLGMPCVATFAGGSSTILKDGVTGILVQDGDPWALAGAVLELSRNRDLALKYAIAARSEAVNRHSINDIVSNLTFIYQEIINEKAL